MSNDTWKIQRIVKGEWFTVVESPDREAAYWCWNRRRGPGVFRLLSPESGVLERE